MEDQNLIKANKSYGTAIYGVSVPFEQKRLCVLMLFRYAKLRAASEKVRDEQCSEHGRGRHTRDEGHSGPERGGDHRAVEQSGPGCFGPWSGGEEQGCGEGSGEQPAGVVTEGYAVVGAAFGPHPEAQGGRTRVDDGIHADQEQGGVEDVEEA